MNAAASNNVVPLRPLYLSPSKLATYERCPKAYWYQYVERLRSEADSVNLVYGDAVDYAIDQGLRRLIAGFEPDFQALFEARWGRLIEEKSIILKPKTTDRTWDLEDFRKAGILALGAFETWWEQAGYTVWTMANGSPAIQQSVEVHFPDNIIVRGKIDVVLADTRGQIAPIDWKTAAQKSPPGFERKSDQLTFYELAMRVARKDFNASAKNIGGARFVELLKRKRDAQVYLTEACPSRTDQQLATYIRKVQNIGRAIRAAEFDERSGMAFNTPCGMCDFSALCIYGLSDGLIQRESKKAA